ncbi:DUF4222 domain-containing protein [Yersinia kristensenii]|uniref:DUF4222 domain-containing protein n=1 Tax=Yersinia kristensenii TaxID=28152 RepID=UPI0011A469AA|nr:DUF4222 domain-containing protein [Yersinia kristensenii]
MPQQIENLDRYYTDKRGVRVHVVRYDRAKDEVIFIRDGYEHGECSKPAGRFREELKRVDV